MKLAITLPSRIYNLGALRRAMAAAAHLIVLAAAQMSARDCLKQARLCASLTRSLIARSVHNQRLFRKKAMQANPVRRAQVLSDLGGEAALIRWEVRLERARKKAIFDAAKARYEARGAQALAPKPTHKSTLLAVKKRAPKLKCERYPNLFHDPCKLDRSGVFRLAAIKRGARGVTPHRQEPRAGVLRREGKVRARSGLYAPIALLPKDLRVRVREDLPEWPRPVNIAASGGAAGRCAPRFKPP